jgi:predicted transcriptional regulator with HTH domain
VIINYNLDDGMSENDNVNFKYILNRPLVFRALRRSNVRKKIVEYLFKISPSSSYTSEIAYSVKTTPTNVIGAIRGMESRYKKEESLIDLNIVEECSENHNIKLYRLTNFGIEIIKNINKDISRD